MTKLSLELVGRNLKQLEEEVTSLQPFYNQIDYINVPDLPWRDNFLRCLQGTQITRKFKPSIPHIRSTDYELDNLDSLISTLKDQDIKKVLVVSGDSRHLGNFTTSSLDLVSALSLKGFEPYVVFDQFRKRETNQRWDRNELKYLQKKLGAGAVGAFTQPIFCEESTHEILNDVYGVLGKLFSNFHLGFTTIVDHRKQKPFASKSYWEKENNAYIPNSFGNTLERNYQKIRDFADVVEDYGCSRYDMPITQHPKEYLKQILDLGYKKEEEVLELQPVFA